MRILFMGGKNVGYGCLEFLLRSKKNVVGVFLNKEDDKKSRWHKSLRELCDEYYVKSYKKRDINSKRSVTLIKRLKPDIIFTVYFNQILKREIISIPRHGCINLHLALAEEYRGCYPTTWAIINGEKETGVTLHYINEEIDGGDIIAQEKTTINKYDTGKSLYDKCTKLSIKLFNKTFPLIEKGKISGRKQTASLSTRYYKRHFPSHEINLRERHPDLYNYVRALIFEPFPKPYFYIGNKRFIIQEHKKCIKH